MNEDKNYKVYMHINKINNKVYIGQTKQDVKQRWREGRGYKQSPRFHNAIQKYGWDNFEHIVLFDGLTLEEANQKEEALILEYNSTDDEYGYNIAYGGDNHVISEESIKKMRRVKELNKDNYDFYQEVFQYDMDGNFLNRFSSHHEASRVTGVCRTNISHCCKGDAKSAGGYLWSNEKVDNIKYCSLKQRQVDRYSKSGEYIDSFSTAKIASKELNVDPSAIYACCNGDRKSAYGFIWRFHDSNLLVEKYFRERDMQVKQINRYNLEVIEIFDTIINASRKTNISANSISLCCKDILKTAGNYIWRYTDDERSIDLDYINTRQATNGKVVNVYNKDGELLYQFNSAQEASKKMTEMYNVKILSSKISLVCHKERSHHHGFIFRYDEDDELKNKAR